jgi:hypothetical protein
VKRQPCGIDKSRPTPTLTKERLSQGRLRNPAESGGGNAVHFPRKSSSLLARLKANVPAGERSETFTVGGGQPVASGRLWSTTWKERLPGKMLRNAPPPLLHRSRKDGGPHGGCPCSSSQNGYVMLSPPHSLGQQPAVLAAAGGRRKEASSRRRRRSRLHSGLGMESGLGSGVGEFGGQGPPGPTEQ